MINRPLKVLWLTNNLTPDHAIALGMPPSPREGWIPSLAKALVIDGRIKLAIATSLYAEKWRFVDVLGVRYYTIPQPTIRINANYLSNNLVSCYQRVVDDFKPDIIHIHGTESFHGLLSGRKYVKIPTVISIQGIINSCAQHYLDDIPLKTIFFKRTLRDWVRRDGLLEQKLSWLRRASIEHEIFSSNTFFIGRTVWDKMFTQRLNPKSQYFHCDEIIREPFYHAKWEIHKAIRHQIFCSSAAYPLKGFHKLVKAVALLKEEFPDIMVRVPMARIYPYAKGFQRFWLNCRSMGYARYLTDLIRTEKLEKQVISFPYIDAEGVKNEMLNARVFVLPSYVENSPNSLAEAMLLGVPSVCSNVGGVTSMVRDGKDALLTQAGDEIALAKQIRRLFLDDDLAIFLSMNASDAASQRHNIQNIINETINIYRTIYGILDCTPQVGQNMLE